MIEGVLTVPLIIFSNESGQVLHMLRSDSPFFQKFGEIYFSTVNPGKVKGWKKHLKMTQHFAVPAGNIRLVIYDNREFSQTQGNIQEIDIGTNNYQLVIIPPFLWYSFSAVGNVPAIVANCADMPHDPEEMISINPDTSEIPYRWEKGF